MFGVYLLYLERKERQKSRCSIIYTYTKEKKTFVVCDEERRNAFRLLHWRILKIFQSNDRFAFVSFLFRLIQTNRDDDD